MQSVARLHVAAPLPPQTRPAARPIARARVVASAVDPDFSRTERTSRRIEERRPLIDHVLVEPPQYLEGLPPAERNASRLLTLCSQQHALHVLRRLQPNVLFAEARLDHQPPPPPRETARLREIFTRFGEGPLHPIQAEGLMRYHLTDIYAAIRGLLPRGTIGRRRATACADVIMRELHPHLAPPPSPNAPPSLTTLFDLPAEDGARRIERYLGRKETALARVAVVSQFPYALAAHLNPYISVRTHDCVTPFGDADRAERLLEQRRRILIEAAERQFGPRAQRRMRERRDEC